MNHSGKIAELGILEIANHFPNIRVDKFVVMPNHIHLILVLQTGSSSLPAIIGQYKAFVTKEIRKTEKNLKVWQTSFHDHVIRDQRSYENIWLYIEANPDNWEKDCFFEE